MKSTVSDGEVIAYVAGQPWHDLPKDLFIPPDALKIWLDSFSGPLDLLLYLIRRQNIDILDLPMTTITQQYLNYIALMKRNRLELASDYLVMAALLIEIKSRMLLPGPKTLEDTPEEDPRMALVQRLQSYEQFKQAAAWLDGLPRYDRDIFPMALKKPPLKTQTVYPEVSLSLLTQIWVALMKRCSYQEHHQIEPEPLSVRTRMITVLEQLRQGQHRYEFSLLLHPEEGRRGLVVTFLAVLELARQSLLVILQATPGAPLYLQVQYEV